MTSICNLRFHNLISSPPPTQFFRRWEQLREVFLKVVWAPFLDSIVGVFILFYWTNHSLRMNVCSCHFHFLLGGVVRRRKGYGVDSSPVNPMLASRFTNVLLKKENWSCLIALISMSVLAEYLGRTEACTLARIDIPIKLWLVQKFQETVVKFETAKFFMEKSKMCRYVYIRKFSENLYVNVFSGTPSSIDPGTPATPFRDELSINTSQRLNFLPLV